MTIVQKPDSASSFNHSEVAEIMIRAPDDKKHKITNYGCPSLARLKIALPGVEKSFFCRGSLALASIAWLIDTTLARAMIGATVPINAQNGS